jgi:hypothetical protein
MTTRKAEKLYVDFHKYEAKKIGEFPSGFYIPGFATFVGPAVHVLYRSSKYDPVTYMKPDRPIDYIHEHGPGVKICIVDDDDGPERKVPQYIQNVGSLTLLGKCLGFAYVDEDGDVVDATCTSCELYAIPSGKALLVVEKKKKVLVLIWGGKLNVEPRGIVG